MINALGRRFRPRLGVPVGIESKETGTYADKVLATRPGNLIRYWPLWDAAGPNAEELIVGDDGTYVGVTLGQPGIGDGQTCPLFDGSAGYVDIYSASLETAFSGDELTVVIWLKVSGAGVWVDGDVRRPFHIYVDGNNYIFFWKLSGDNEIGFRHKGGGSLNLIDGIAISTTDFFLMGLTVTKTGNEMKAYIDGSQVGTIQSGFSSWVGSFSSTQTVICAESTAPNQPWDGYAAHCAIWTKALTGAEMLALATV